MKNETKEQRAERKQMYLTQVVRHAQGVDDVTFDKIMEEASNKFEKNNQLKTNNK